MDGPLLAEDVRRHRRTVALLGATLLTPFFALDAYAPPGFRGWLVLVRAGWIASLLLGARLLRPGSRAGERLPEVLLAGSSTLATLAVVGLTGGTTSGFFGFLFALPFCLALLLPGGVLAAALAAAGTLGGGTAYLVAAGTPAVELARWLATATVVSILAAYSTRASRTALRRRIEAERARAELAERLVESSARLEAAERLALAGRLAAGVAHEVNNPLAYAKTNLQWIRHRLQEAPVERGDAELDEAISETQVGLQRIARIAADLRLFSRAPPEDPCGSDLAGSAAEAQRIATVRGKAGIAVLLEVPAGLPEARICRGRLVQVLVNLIVNAADAVAEARPGGPGRIAVRAERSGDRLLVAVEDDGPGFPEAHLARASEPFLTTKAPGRGTGLGLALAHEYVTRAGGRIALGNRQPGGARVTLELPISTGQRGRCQVCEYGTASAGTGRPGALPAAG